MSGRWVFIRVITRFIWFFLALWTGAKRSDHRVNYDVLEQPPVVRGKPPTEHKHPKKDEALSRPVQRGFEVTIRRSATPTSEVRVAAPDEKAAREKALEMVKKQPFEPVTEQDEVIRVK